MPHDTPADRSDAATRTNLIVARMDPASADTVAGLFARSDATELPAMVGVRTRTLLRFHDLYFHLITSDADVAPRVGELREHPLFREINESLAEHISPYHPSWREPKDAMAQTFYEWRRA